MELLDYVSHPTFISLKTKDKYFRITMQAIPTEEEGPSKWKTLEGVFIPFGTYQFDILRERETILKQTFETQY